MRGTFRRFFGLLCPKSYLTFIGEDGSMNLTHGKVYRVKIFTDTLPFSRKTHIWVVWKPDPEPNAVHEPPCSCPYASVNAMAKNWRLPEKGYNLWVT